MQRALLCNAAKIMIAYNHPSGDPEPSKEDIDITKKLFNVCQLMEVEFCDHIIIGRDSYFSFLEDYSREQKKKEKRKKRRSSDESIRFFKIVQNKLHFAAHAHTAAEVIYKRQMQKNLVWDLPRFRESCLH